MNDSVPVLSLPIKTTLDRFTFAVFLVAMAAHSYCSLSGYYQLTPLYHITACKSELNQVIIKWIKE